MYCMGYQKGKWAMLTGIVWGVAAVLLVAGMGCVDPDPDPGPGPGEEPYLTGEVDILWIVDSSNSMAQDQADLAAGLPGFLDGLAVNAPDLDYRMAVTTTQTLPCSIDPAAFDDCLDSMGNTGRLRGLSNADQDTNGSPTLVSPTSPDLVPDMQALVDVGIEGSTREMGIWTTALTACASLPLSYPTDFIDWDEDSPVECDGTNWDLSDPWAEFCRCLPPEAVDYNEDSNGNRFLRNGADLAVIIVSDEGDYTPVMGDAAWPWDIAGCSIGDPWPPSIQQSCANNPEVICADHCKLDKFLDFFDTLGRDVVISVIGPDAELVEDANGNFVLQVACNDQNVGADMISFYLWAARLTGGVYAPLNVHDEGGCSESGMDDALDQLSSLFYELAEE